MTVTVQKFLQALCEPAGENVDLWVCTYPEDPYANDRHWSGRKYTLGDELSVDGQNAFYSISVFPKNADARKIVTSLGAVVVLLDDADQKGGTQALTLFGEPSFKIQTSEGSQQWGYFLTELAGNKEMAQVHSKLVELNYCDKSGNNLIRYGRLPGGHNNKSKYPEPYKVHCVEWHPERRRPIAYFSEQLAVVPAAAMAETPREDKTAELIRLVMSGESMHDSLRDLAAIYAAKGMKRESIIAALRGFMEVCRGHGGQWQNRYDDIPRLVDTAIEKFEPIDDQRDVVAIRTGAAAETDLAVIDVLAQRGVEVNIFARGRSLVRPYIAERAGIKKDEKVPSLELAQLSPETFAHELNTLIRFEGYRAGEGGSVRKVKTDCPAKVAETVLKLCHKWRGIPQIHQVASCPIYVGEGRLLATPGYHPEVATYLDVPPGIGIPKKPTREQAEAALKLLYDLISEFSCESPRDKSAMLAIMMTCVLRASLEAAPGGAIDAAVIGAGKSTATRMCVLVATGRQPSVVTYSLNPEEFEKRLDSFQIAGAAGIVIDNVKTGMRVESEALASIITEPYREARELGRSRMHTVPCTQFVLVNGNNLVIAQDLTRRFIVCRLNPGPVDAVTRVFARPNFLAHVAKSRVEILNAIFTIVAAYEASAETVASLPLASFEQWCRWVQQPLMWLGLEDPCASTHELREDDPESVGLDRVGQFWHEAHGAEWLRTEHLTSVPDMKLLDAEKKQAFGELHAALAEVIGTTSMGLIDRHKLGQWLKKMKGRYTSDGRLALEQKKPSKTSKITYWRFAGVGSEGSNGVISPSGGFRTNPVRKGSGGKDTPPHPRDPSHLNGLVPVPECEQL